ncbi:PhzF family phenazine biosynthesis protein [Rubrolithibacter danxiaensis]|uniref:PhzF family phenazine biosynthesis protein n=1 Tax=Rubrolithibacter danxiaensis TaxID=3390805 RepID=UPI003BF8F51B
MKQLNFFQADAFTNTPFKGNPAAICILDEELDEKTMQQIAFENNLAETAFVSKREDGFNLRWFTPTVEVNLCGHATLASAHILWQEGILSESETANFYTRSGILTATKRNEWIQLNFPASSITPVEYPAWIDKALNAKPVHVVYAKDRFIAELSSTQELSGLTPDFDALRRNEMVVVTSKGDDRYDFYSRSFAGAHGVDEDPVTGSSHCGLVPYWAEKLNKTEMFAYQASSRGGELNVQLDGDRVLMAGKAVTVIKGLFVL